MKKTFFILSIFSLLMACSGSDDSYQNNPNLPNVNFRFQLNLNLPEYNDLQFPGNSFADYNQGVRGVVIYNINGQQFTAFELSDPNHPPSSCSGMTVNGVIATCRCDDNEYNVITGELVNGDGEYTMRPYRVQRSGDILEVYN